MGRSSVSCSSPKQHLVDAVYTSFQVRYLSFASWLWMYRATQFSCLHGSKSGQLPSLVSPYSRAGAARPFVSLESVGTGWDKKDPARAESLERSSGRGLFLWLCLSFCLCQVFDSDGELGDLSQRAFGPEGPLIDVLGDRGGCSF